MQLDGPYDSYVSLVRGVYVAALVKCAGRFSRVAGDPYGAARERGRHAHPVFTHAIRDAAVEEIRDRVDLLVTTMGDVLKGTNAALSTEDLLRAFNEIAGEREGAPGPAEAFADVYKPVDHWAITQSVRTEEDQALDGGRALVRVLGARVAADAVHTEYQSRGAITVDNRFASIEDLRGTHVDRGISASGVPVGGRIIWMSAGAAILGGTGWLLTVLGALPVAWNVIRGLARLLMHVNPPDLPK